MNNCEVSVESFPPHPYVEAGETGQVLHIDFKLTNRTTKVVELQELVTSVTADGEVIYRRHIDQNGLPSALSTVPGLPVAPGGSVTIFNPLERFPRDLPLASVTYKFVLGTPGTAARWERSIELSPRSMPTGPELVLPLRGRLLVYEAHDYYGHHRRLDTQHPMVRDLGLTSNSGRFSYDLSLVDVNGRMFRGDGTRNDDWYSWEQQSWRLGPESSSPARMTGKTSR
ncbi:MAG TPA: hypothetical protein VD789_02270 [Thermomicrobiales bacterium]|nr:hypothetical protein [Thermomicrobiales bacterium]